MNGASEPNVVRVSTHVLGDNSACVGCIQNAEDDDAPTTNAATTAAVSGLAGALMLAQAMRLVLKVHVPGLVVDARPPLQVCSEDIVTSAVVGRRPTCAACGGVSAGGSAVETQP